MGKTLSLCWIDKKEVSSQERTFSSSICWHVLIWQEEITKCALPSVTEGQTRHCPLAPFVLVLFREASQPSYLFSVWMWTHVLLCASLKDFQLLLQEHMFLQPKILAQASPFGSRAINESGSWCKSRKPGHRGRQWPNYWQLLKPHFSAF